MQPPQKLEITSRHKRLQNMQWHYRTRAHSHIQDVYTELPQAWKRQSPPPDLLHLGANSPYLECLQVPGEQSWTKCIISSWFFGLPRGSCKSLGSHRSPKAWPTFWYGKELLWGPTGKQQGQKCSWTYWILMNQCNIFCHFGGTRLSEK